MAKLKSKKESAKISEETEVSKLPEVVETKPEEVTFTAIATDVKPIATKGTAYVSNVGKVQIVHKTNGRIIAKAASKALAEKIVRDNPNLKIVQ